jgi:hypothetical protein
MRCATKPLSSFSLVLDRTINIHSWSTRGDCGEFALNKLIQYQKISKSKIIFISFSTLRKKIPFEVATFVTTRGKPLADLRREIVSHLPATPTAPPASANLTSEFLSRPCGHVHQTLTRKPRMPPHNRQPPSPLKQPQSTPLAISLLPSRYPSNLSTRNISY